ncbi:MAG: AraC family ligand binding domain-containing protein [Elusimicrobia bacterium]|nr:AraC family ligand binding domain-containing protein [Elusimicrobiota bacterium]
MRRPSVEMFRPSRPVPIESVLKPPSSFTFDLAAETARLKHGDAWLRTGHNAKVLAKHPHLRVLLTVLKVGTRIPRHRVEERISIQTVVGKLRFHLPARTLDLASGHLLVIEPGVQHDMEAVSDCAFLLSISWPKDPLPLEPERPEARVSDTHAFRAPPASPTRPWKLL